MHKALRDNVMKAGPGRDPQFTEACKKAADTILAEGRAGFVQASKGKTLNEIESVLATAGAVEPQLSEDAKYILKKFADSKGLYVPGYDIVLLREGDNLGHALVQEHFGQTPKNATHWSRTSMAAKSGLSPSSGSGGSSRSSLI
jgi:hypothetical protein